MEQRFSQQYLVTISSLGLASLVVLSFPSLAQTSPSEIDSPNLDRTIPRESEPLPQEPPSPPEEPELQLPEDSDATGCQLSTELDEPYDSYRDRFFIREIEVLGNTVLQPEIERLIKESKIKYRTATFDDLVCLRSRITDLYIERGYVTSGAFLVNNQDLSDGTVEIQVVEGELETIRVSGLERLSESYVTLRLDAATATPLDRDSLERALQLLILNPLIDTVSAELTAGKQVGSNVLRLDIEEADAFNAGLAVDNYRAPSIGEIQGSVNLTHNNLLGFGDRFEGQYSLTEGLNIYNLGYTFPLNSSDGTLRVSYDNSDSDIIEEEFRDLDIESETETFGVNLSQPLLRSPNREFSLSFGMDLRRRRTFLLGEPFSFSPGVEDGESNLTVLRFAQNWVNRNATSVFAVRSQLNFGIDAFDATINDNAPDGEFFAWQGQFQWVQQLTSRNLLVARIGTQLSSDALLSLEQFSLGGISTVRGYQENQLITDNGVLGSLELRIPLTENPSTLQLTPFFDFGTGWNNEEPDPDPTTLASLGIGLNWTVGDRFNFSLDYGIPLIAVNEEGDSIQENGFHFAVRYQPF
ncbi:ShlB/FhaC/HecB family hemolysin secretion/activation protein [Myxosarcina sp. GI1(2024)]